MIGRVWRARRERLAPIGLFLTVVALTATSLHRTDHWFGDFRFEHNANPGQWAARMGTVWDTSRGFGTFRSEIWPAPTAVFGFLRGAGLSMAWSQNLFHAALLVALGMGVVVLLREWRPDIGWMHLTAALFAMVSPFSVTFMLPSGLFIGYALLPWIMVLVRRGITRNEPWRWAAVLVLVVASVGSVDRAGLAFSGIASAILVLVTIHDERAATWRTTWAWAWRLGVMAVPSMAAILVGLALSAEVTAQDLRETELATFVNIASSWPESWRGLGFWQVYLRDFSGWAKPQSLPYSTGPWTYALTFVGPVIAVVGLAAARIRQRVLLGCLLLIGLVVMVGTHPTGSPSPYGRLLRWLYDVVPATQVLRNSYKAGAIVTLATAMAFGAAVQAGADALAARGPGRRGARSAGIVGLGAVALIGAISHPVWTAGFNGPAVGFVDMPDHVPEAMAWLDDQSGDARVLFAPGAVRNGFRWGFVNDDVLDAMLDRPHVIDVAIHTSRPVAADILSAIDDSLAGARYRDGFATAIGARFGIEYIVLRNDIDWQVWGQPRPAAYEAFRDDPATDLVATFGEPGAFTTDPADRSAEAEIERDLPPIEVYRVADPGGQVTVVSPAAPVVVSGDGDAFPLLDRAGLLAPYRSTLFSGAASTEELTDVLEAGAPVIVTDTNRRVAEYITQSPQRSHTLAAGTRTDREVHELFAREGAETTAVFGQVATIDASTQTTVGDGAPWHRPAQALDGSTETSWLVGGLGEPLGERFRVTFDEARVVEALGLVVAQPPVEGDRRVIAADVTTSTGRVVTVDLRSGSGEARWTAEPVAWIEVTIAALEGLGLGPVGFSSIDVVGIDTRERLEVPDDVFLAADRDADLASALGRAPVGYVFGRLTGSGPVDEERELRRRFRTGDLDAMTIDGELAVGPSAPEALLTAIEAREVTASASSRYRDLVPFRGNAAVDGDRRTGWTVDNRTPASLALSFGQRTVDTVRVRLRHGAGLVLPSAITVSADGAVIAEVTVPDTACETGQCTAALDIPLPAARTLSSLELGLPGLGEELDEQPVRIDEVDFGAPFTDANAVGDAPCLSDVVAIDGVSVPVAISGEDGFLDTGTAVAFTACELVSIDAGWHELVSGTGVLLDVVSVLPDGIRESLVVDRPDVTVAADRTDATGWHIALEGDDAVVLSLGQSWHPGWRASIDGTDLGAPRSVDGLAAWLVPAGPDRRITVSFAPQTVFEGSLLLSLLSLTVVGAVALDPGRHRRTLAVAAPVVPWAQRSMRRASALVVGAAMASYLIGGWSGMALGVVMATVVAADQNADRRRLPLAMAAAALAVTATIGVVGHRFGEAQFTADFAISPEQAPTWGRYAGVLLAVGVLAVAIRGDSGASSPGVGMPSPPWPIRPRRSWALPAITAAVAAVVAATLDVGSNATIADVARDFALGRGTAGATRLDLFGSGPLVPAVLAVLPFAEHLLVPVAAAVIERGVARTDLVPGSDRRSRAVAAAVVIGVLAGLAGLSVVGVATVAVAFVAVASCTMSSGRAPGVRTGLALGAATLTHPFAFAAVVVAAVIGRRKPAAVAVMLAAVAVLEVPWLLWRLRHG